MPTRSRMPSRATSKPSMTLLNPSPSNEKINELYWCSYLAGAPLSCMVSKPSQSAAVNDTNVDRTSGWHHMEMLGTQSTSGSDCTHVVAGHLLMELGCIEGPVRQAGSRSAVGLVHHLGGILVEMGRRQMVDHQLDWPAAGQHVDAPLLACGRSPPPSYVPSIPYGFP